MKNTAEEYFKETISKINLSEKEKEILPIVDKLITAFMHGYACKYHQEKMDEKAIELQTIILSQYQQQAKEDAICFAEWLEYNNETGNIADLYDKYKQSITEGK